MKAATFQGVRRVDVRTKDAPRLQEPTDVLVAVELAGLCGSDLHPYRGRERGLDRGTTMGHEFTGRVVEVGSSVRNLRVGDVVFGPFTTSCAACGPCRRGLSARCEGGELFGWVEDGKGLEGGQAEVVRVPLADTTLLRRPEAITPVEALLLGDVVSTGFYIADRARVGPGSRVAVLGLGAVGLSALLACRERGAEAIAAIDGVPQRLAMAERFGATPVSILGVDGSALPETAIARETRRILGSEGASEVLEAVGSPEATRLAVEIARVGGTISIAGFHTEEAFAVSPGRAYDRNLAILTGRCPVRSRLADLCQLQLERQLPIAELITHRLPITEAADAYRMFDERLDGCIKVLFET